jgi:ribonuclease HII
MYNYENTLYAKGVRFVCGVDEAGRGPLAGPVVAGAVILNPEINIAGLNDSKQLSAKQREKLAKLIESDALAYAVYFVSPETVDKINIYQASKLAMMEAINKLTIKPEYILSDAMPLKEITTPCIPIIKGDTLSASIAAGSILAKVARDHYMEEIALLYPGYGFEKHKGYPTKQHLEALNRLGPTAIHRKSYQPVKKMIEQQLQWSL